MELSRLDEYKGLRERSQADLLAAAEEAAQRFENTARKKEIQFTVQGESVHIAAYPVLLSEMLDNLINNAVKYTRPGGKVEVSVRRMEQGVLFGVRETGVDAPPRVFERFYRVDKSHSRASGGTGLRLSIVKHAARIHGARIILESKPGVGTDIWLPFPNAT